MTRLPTYTRAVRDRGLLALATVALAARAAGSAPPGAGTRAAFTGPPRPPAGPPRPVPRHGPPRLPGTYVTLHTSLGDIVLRMLPEDAPHTVANFVGLVEGTRPFQDPAAPPGRKRMVKRPFYDGLTFHRVLRGFMIQGGCPAGDGTGGPGYQVPDELPPRHPYTRGALLMSRGDRPNSAGSQFFILQADVRGHLPPDYVVFGFVVAGMEVVDRIADGAVVPNHFRPAERSTPVAPVIIQHANVTRVR
jgi:peptidyl-prolyl cis-trans isomerase A (cyclophilin A)